ncbi:MAG: anti-sigma factor, partial [Pyrinomonadaceae bacterium]
MNCRDCEQLLEEYFDGELGARDRALVAAHLASCEACAATQESLAAEQSLYTAYERDLEISPRLWDGVAARIRDERSGGEVGLLRKLSTWFAPLLTVPRFSPALTAALVVAAIVLTVGVMKLAGSRTQPSTELARGGSELLNVNRNAAPAPATP